MLRSQLSAWMFPRALLASNLVERTLKDAIAVCRGMVSAFSSVQHYLRELYRLAKRRSPLLNQPQIATLLLEDYSGSHWCEVRGVGVEPTGAQGARPLHPLYSTDLQTAIFTTPDQFDSIIHLLHLVDQPIQTSSKVRDYELSPFTWD